MHVSQGVVPLALMVSCAWIAHTIDWRTRLVDIRWTSAKNRKSCVYQSVIICAHPKSSAHTRFSFLAFWDERKLWLRITSAINSQYIRNVYENMYPIRFTRLYPFLSATCKRAYKYGLMADYERWYWVCKPYEQYMYHVNITNKQNTNCIVRPMQFCHEFSVCVASNLTLFGWHRQSALNNLWYILNTLWKNISVIYSVVLSAHGEFVVFWSIFMAIEWQKGPNPKKICILQLSSIYPLVSGTGP